MLRNHLKIAFRNLWGQKGYSLINTSGLALGIAVCALIFLWVQDELRYDRFHEKADRIYRVLWDGRYGDNEWRLARTPIPLADVLRDQFPEAEAVVRFTSTSRTFRLGRDWVNENRVLRVEPTFFDVFTVSFQSGHPATALRSPSAIVITEEAARRYFPEGDPLGKSLSDNNGNVYQVTGVVQAFPPRSHFHFDFLIPLNLQAFSEGQRTTWGSPPVYTYFAAENRVSAPGIEARLQQFVSRTVASEGFFAEERSRYTLPLEPLTDIHLRSTADLDLSPPGNITYVVLFSLIGIFIIVLACINFVNLATARAARRAKEVGVRKVLGSYRTQLIRQFLVESFVYVLLAVTLALFLIGMALPAFNAFAGKEFALGAFGAPLPLSVMAAIVVIVTILAGAYPAFMLSSFRPVNALKGTLMLNLRRDRLRDGLVVLQFCISIGLLVGTLVVQDQLEFIQSRQLGFDKEHVLVVEHAGFLGQQFEAFKEELGKRSEVISTSGTQSLPGDMFDSTVFEPEQPASYEASSVNYAWVDEGYMEVLDLQIVEGRNFSRSADSSAFLINEAAARALGWANPIGRTMRMGNIVEGPVIGVVEDFHYASLHTEIEALFLPFLQWTPSHVAVRLRPGNTADGVAAVEEVWNAFEPDRPFEYSFLDQSYDRLYESEQQVASVYRIFAILALCIACLGLSGLASYAVVQRTKEIGIRKVVGASAGSIVALLSRDVGKLVAIACLIAAPLAYFSMQQWLEGFAYRIEIGPGIFLLAGTFAMLIAVLTVMYQSVKAALTDPVESLRYE